MQQNSKAARRVSGKTAFIRAENLVAYRISKPVSDRTHTFIFHLTARGGSMDEFESGEFR